MPEPMRPQPMTPTFWMVMSVSPRGRRRLVARATTRQGRRLVVGRSRRAWIPDGDCDGAGPGAAHADDLLCGDPHRDASLVVDDEGMERVVLQLAATMEERELDQERHADDVAPELLDQPERRGHRAARGEQVVDGEHALARPD